MIQALNESTRIPAELIKEGNELNEKRMYQEAILRYDEAVKIEPSSELAWYGKGVALQYLSRYEEAIKCYDKALEINPNAAHAWNRKGGALYGLRRYEEAIKCYDKALEINPNYWTSSLSHSYFLFVVWTNKVMLFLL